jgi:hypothetical protein
MVLQIDAAVQAFAGLALSLGTPSGTTINALAALAVSSAAAIWSAAA